MPGILERTVFRFAGRKEPSPAPPPLLVELLREGPSDPSLCYEAYPFRYSVWKGDGVTEYGVAPLLDASLVLKLREAVAAVSQRLDPESVEPTTFVRLVEVLRQLAASVAPTGGGPELGRTLDLVAYEAIGMSRILALAMDPHVTEFFADSDATPLYLDHSVAGRCSTSIILTERERKAVETHLDTFRGYSLDYRTPSLKNDLDIAGARLRVSLDLEPLSVNRFSVDVRRLNITSLTLRALVASGTASLEAASFLMAWLAAGGNVTIVGETGTGKTTLLNALDEMLDRNLRRVYIEDAVETLDLLGRGYHQMKLKVSPFERGEGSTSGKEEEIVKVLHRSPDIVVLSEIQSAEHSRAFFHALSAGIRGMQTFHASSIEQAARRWTTIHGIPEENLLDLGLMVQMARPERLGPERVVSRICGVAQDSGSPRFRELFCRDRSFSLVRVADWDRIALPAGTQADTFRRAVSEAEESLRGAES